MADSATTSAGWQAHLAAHVFTLAFFGIWYGVSWLVPAYQLPGPEDVAVRLWAFLNIDGLIAGGLEWLTGWAPWSYSDDYDEVLQMLYSFEHILRAVSYSLAGGLVIALIAHFVWPTRTLVHGRLSPFLNSFSGVGWIFLAVIWFGVGKFSVVFVITMVLLPFAIINMREGLLSLDRELLEMSRSFSRSWWKQFTKIILPSLDPILFATIRVSFGVAWKVGLTAEFFSGGRGMGYLLSLAQNDFDSELIFTVVVIIVAFVVFFDRFVFGPAQRRRSRHHAS